MKILYRQTSISISGKRGIICFDTVYHSLLKVLVKERKHVWRRMPHIIKKHITLETCSYFNIRHRLKGSEQKHEPEAQNDNAGQPLIHDAGFFLFYTKLHKIYMTLYHFLTRNVCAYCNVAASFGPQHCSTKLLYVSYINIFRHHALQSRLSRPKMNCTRQRTTNYWKRDTTQLSATSYHIWMLQTLSFESLLNIWYSR